MQLAEAATGHKQPDCLVLILCCFYNHFVFVDYSYSILKVSSNANVFFFLFLYKHATDVQERAVGQLFLFFYSAVITACVRSTRSTRAAGIVLSWESGTTHAR
jgi:hypothetical protein